MELTENIAPIPINIPASNPLIRILKKGLLVLSRAVSVDLTVISTGVRVSCIGEEKVKIKGSDTHRDAPIMHPKCKCINDKDLSQGFEYYPRINTLSVYAFRILFTSSNSFIVLACTPSKGYVRPNLSHLLLPKL